MGAAEVHVSWCPGLGSCPGGIEFEGWTNEGGTVVRMVSLETARGTFAVLDFLAGNQALSHRLALTLQVVSGRDRSWGV